MAGKMNFKNLYEKSSKEIQQTIIRMWEEYAPNMVEAYRNQLEDILKDNISSNIVVEDMSNWESTDKNWRAVVNENIWRKWITKDADKSDDNNIVPIKSNPYKHQYESWSKLLKESKSIVVTSGTGSGKTECFMIPLIHDLVYEQDVNREDAVEAIFLYPLNALMEDQRERMSNYIRFSQSCNIENKKNITFAVYNGNTPENVAPGGLLYNEIGTRNEIRSKKPNILFTNPSMLEYMLLRKKDQGLFTKNLKWIVIDEAHTYSGSAGAELALLLKRVLHACGNPDNVKFATSSATIGNDDGQLKQFIADITGQETSQIEIVKGRRKMPESLSEDKKQLLHNENFVLLNQLFTEGTITEKLAKLDNLTEEELKVRLHYFVKALTAGLYIDPTQDLTSDGKFKLLTGIPLVNGKLDPHPLSAYYCSQCGAILGYGVLGENNTYTRDIKELSTLDCEDSEIEGDEDDDNKSFLQGASGTGKFFIGIASDTSVGIRANVDGNRLNDCFDNTGKYVYSEMKKKDGKDISECPCCGANGAHKASPLHSFHLSADFIGRLIAPILLDQTCEVENNNKVLPRQGRKYITFADSRQSAAGPTLKQNLETEEVWVTGVLYKKLLDVQPLTVEEFRKLQSEQNELKEVQMFGTLTNEKSNRLMYISSRIENIHGYLTWHDAMKALLEDSNCERMCLAFATNNKEEDIDQLKRKYVLSALYRTMNKRPAGGKNSPENWGLICTYYPDIEKLNQENIPNEVRIFNNLINSEENKIDSRDWHNFVKLFIDYNIRSNQSVFFKLYEERNGLPINGEWKEIDIDDIRNYRTEEGSRRQIKHSKLAPSGDRYIKLLCRLLEKNGVGDLTNNEKSAIEGVLAALWDALRTNQIAEESQKIIWNWKNKERKFERWSRSTRDDDFYMNLTRIAFKLYDEKIQFDEHLKIPLDTTFKGYSPYSGEDDKYNVQCVERGWNRLSPNNAPLNVKEWFDTNRADIAHRWTMKLERILEYICSGENRNTLYIQAEHTAQVARSVVKQKTEKFKNGELNIMACSTTMEMGVDLGDLELVVMNNVPPQPANYKQRAGRAGRGDQNKSASVTLCGGDSIGETLLKNPLDGFIQRMVTPPKIDLGRASHQLIQRHINSMLLREFAKKSDIGISGGRDGEDDKGWKICDLFTCYSLENVENPNKNNKTYIRVKDDSNGGSIVFPRDYKDLINDDIHTNSSLRKFLDKLDEWTKDDDVKNAVKALVRGTALEGRDSISLMQNTRKSILAIANDIHDELSTIKDDWKTDFEHNSNPTTKKGCSLYWQFANVLNANLLTYLSNHQFTPNANMPSNIVEMILKMKESFWDKTENPTRDLRTALSEYAPGRLVFVDGRTYRMGGVDWNKKRPNQHIKCCAQGHTWMGAANQCPTCDCDSENWPHFGQTIKMITPTGYYPSSDVSRITQKEAMNVEIGVELIGVGNWEENKTHKLYALRTNKDAHNSHIVYYDKGLGFGYHICKKCGYAVPAPMLWDGKEDNLINLMYSPISYIDRQTGRKEEYYQHNYRYECKMDDNKPCDNIERNIVLGGVIQTDYCEIALYDHRTLNLSRMRSDEDTKKIAHTLGVLLCNELSRKIGFDRGELDFVVRTQNSEVSLCIFDVAKGGSGRAKLLPELISELLDNARNILSGCESVQQILDRNTMRYAEYIDIEGAKAWLNKEYESRTIIPAGFPANSQNSSYFEIAYAIQHMTNADNVFLFVNNDFANWNYDGDGENDDPCWKNCREYMKPRGNNKYNLVIINAPNIVPAEDSVVLEKLKDYMHLKSATWNNDVYKPLAIVGDVLYVTNVDDYTLIDEKWAADSVWKCNRNQLDIPISEWKYRTDADSMDCKEIQPYTKTTTKSFIDLLRCEAINIFQQSANGCQKLTIEYSDRYLCNQLGMIITHQLINKIIEKVGCQTYSIKYNTNIEEEKLYYGKDIDSTDRSLTDNIKKSKFVEYMQTLVNPDESSNIEINGCSWKDLNHDRSLVIKSDRGGTLIIRPDGGFCRGWNLDRDAAKRRGQWYDTKCGIDDDIPIYSAPKDGRYLYYVIYKRSTHD